MARESDRVAPLRKEGGGGDPAARRAVIAGRERRESVCPSEHANGYLCRLGEEPLQLVVHLEQGE
jgi:hypothetical protein